MQHAYMHARVHARMRSCMHTCIQDDPACAVRRRGHAPAVVSHAPSPPATSDEASSTAHTAPVAAPSEEGAPSLAPTLTPTPTPSLAPSLAPSPRLEGTPLTVETQHDEFSPAALRAAFAVFDTNGDGRISASELLRVLQMNTGAGVELGEGEAGTVLADFDRDGSGDLDMDEFAAALAGQLSA